MICNAGKKNERAWLNRQTQKRTTFDIISGLNLQVKKKLEQNK